MKREGTLGFPMRRVLLAVLVLAVLVAPARGEHIDQTGLERQIGQDLIAAVTEPTFNDTEYVGNTDLVIGVADAGTGEATAYPVKVLVWHEIVNDVIGGKPIAVTYCPLCRSGIVYERPARDGEPLVFRVSGHLYRNNLVMYDVQTFSLWPQILGEAINGTYHGTRLRAVTATTETWLEWKAAHPNTRVIARPNPPVCFPDETCIDGGIDYEDDPYEGYYASDRTFQDRVYVDTRLHPKALIFGLALNGEAVAYPFVGLEKSHVINDRVGGIPVVVTYHNGSAQAFVRGDRTFAWREHRTMTDGSGRAFDMVTGEGTSDRLAKVDGIVAFWFAWKDHYPATFVYGIDWPKPFDATPFVIAGVAAAVAVSALVLWRRRVKRKASEPPSE